jgi:capsular polysaccharide biosynthesis protein
MKPESFFLPASISKRAMPVNLRPEDVHLFQNEFAREYPAVAAVTRRDVYVAGNGICYDRSSVVPKAAIVSPGVGSFDRQWWKGVVSTGKGFLQRYRLKESAPVDRGLLLTDVYFDGFFHWFGDILPKLEALVLSGVDLTDCVLLVPHSRYAPYAAFSLAAYGIKVQVIPAGSAALVRELIYIPRLSVTGNYPPGVMVGIQSRMRAMVSAKGPSDRLYISRRLALKRRVLNESDVVDVVTRKGFRVVCMEEFSFAEQVQLASRCSVLAGLHGAGLTQLIWAQPRAVIVEIRGDQDAHNNCYYSLASDLSCPYYYVPAKKQGGFLRAHRADYVVDTQSLEATLSLLE